MQGDSHVRLALAAGLGVALPIGSNERTQGIDALAGGVRHHHNAPPCPTYVVGTIGVEDSNPERWMGLLVGSHGDPHVVDTVIDALIREGLPLPGTHHYLQRLLEALAPLFW